ncbi:unnamed protein product [Cyprideis torosa]|uniref:Uncharacterized protein n=1 Tax=Cyprideis torosa TaxID=163714 RepID=A0A7R8ZPI4_9CRUS|nr:unnamed protein product [Cyprideis torosa]CAG0889961.1 unnamed protein product [Cyprideis torosa]
MVTARLIVVLGRTQLCYGFPQPPPSIRPLTCVNEGHRADASAIDLLPSPVRGNEWTASLVRDEGFAADEVFAFNGVTDAVSLPAGVLPDSLPSPFSLSFWMRHGTNPERTHKEHVLCAADDRGESLS